MENSINRVKHDIENTVISIITKYIKPISIILYGGYGRDEGAWLIDSLSQPKPYNDLDIIVVYDDETEQNIINKIKDEILTSVQVEWVDLSFYSRVYLKKLKISIFNYDLKYASKIIFGNENILNEISEFKSENIPLREIEILFRTRLWTLIGPLGKKGLRRMKGNDSLFFRYQMAKCVLSIVDCHLILRGMYHYSYNKRVERFSKLNTELGPRIIEIANWALTEKLRPKIIDMSYEEVKEIYNFIARTFLDTFTNGLSEFYRFKFRSFRTIPIMYKYHPFNIVKRVYKNVKSLSGKGSLQINIVILQILCVIYELFNEDDLFDSILMYSKKVGIEESNFNVIRYKTSILRNQIE